MTAYRYDLFKVFNRFDFKHVKKMSRFIFGGYFNTYSNFENAILRCNSILRAGHVTNYSHPKI